MEIDALQRSLILQSQQILAQKGLYFYCQELGHQIKGCSKLQNSSSKKIRQVYSLKTHEVNNELEQENGAFQ